MEIINTNIKDKKQLFRVTHAQRVEKMQDLVGQTIDPASGYCLYKETDTVDEETGEVKEKLVFSVIVGDRVYGTISKTFLSAISDILSIFDESDDWKITIGANPSRNGRQFIYAEIV